MYIASVVSIYWVISISMVYLNKVLVSNEGISIPAPLFVTWYQCIVTVIICWIAGLLSSNFTRARDNATGQPVYTAVSVNENGESCQSPSNPPKASFFTQFPKTEYSLGPAKQIFPLSIIFGELFYLVCFHTSSSRVYFFYKCIYNLTFSEYVNCFCLVVVIVGMITFNNLCLKLVEVSFYNVARSLTIVFNVFFSRVFLGIPTSFKTALCLGVVIVGFLMGSHGELNFNLAGTLSGIMSSLFVSLNSIFTKKILPVVDDNHWRLTFYNNVNAIFLFIPLIIYFEADVIKASTEQLRSSQFWSAMSLAGVFGFSIGIVTVLQIKATSPLTHNISGTAKAAVQSLMAFYIWSNDPTILGVLCWAYSPY